MSILIKGMEMPKNCAGCPICCGLPYQYRDEKGRRPDCPLIDIPTPHGRLGDLDALIEEYGEWYTEEGTESGYIGTMKNLLKDAPTVIEAEGET